MVLFTSFVMAVHSCVCHADARVEEKVCLDLDVALLRFLLSWHGSGGG